jgi:hypothetical protein
MRNAVAALALLALSACYHVTVNTGLPEGSTTMHRPWTMTFVAGLIPAAEIDAAEKCKNGVARVETRMSVPNWAVAAITGSLISPWDVLITCAADKSTYLLPPQIDASEHASSTVAVETAARLAAQTGQVVEVRF